MAKLIPSFVDDSTPPGEREVFATLAAGPDDWVALHSLDLAPWNRMLRTEIDFVVFIPDTGVLCIEVKSHGVISFDGEKWIPSTIKRSPFKQAADASYALHRRLQQVAPEFRNVPVVHCCVFPLATFDLEGSLSVASWELMDTRVFRTFRSGKEFCADLRRRALAGIKADGNLSSLKIPLSRSQIEGIVGHCLPIQRRHPDAAAEIRAREEQAKAALQAQQAPILELAKLNARLIVSGAAGTGKTLIAMEVARRAAEQGRRVALVCFNQLVGDWMRQRMSQLRPTLPNFVAGRALQIMVEMTGLKVPESPSRDFWEVVLPGLLEDKLTDPEFRSSAVFDYIVVDEAQDLLARPAIWQCLTHFLVGEVDDGAFFLCGDFDNQVIAQKEVMSKLLGDLERRSRPARWHLSENCRNYSIVGETAVSLSGLGQSIYSGFRRVGGSIENYDIHFYHNDDDQIETLSRWLRRFREQGYNSADVTILSLCAPERSAASKLQKAGTQLKPAWQAGNATSYASIHAFKGMESKIIVMTDVALSNHDFQRDLFYIGMTRATESVRILCDKSSQNTLLNWLRESGNA